MEFVEIASRFGIKKLYFLYDFDSYDEEEDQTNNATLFLMPSTISEDPDGTVDFLVNARRSKDADILRRVKCNENFSAASSEQYACSVILLLPKPIGYEAGSTHTAYLRVNPLYNSGTSFKLSLFDQSDNKVDFKSVQPIVDSTGRANDLFRRVKSRVELESSSIPGIEAAVDISGSLCKSFTAQSGKSGCRKIQHN